jgi:adenosine deaminase
MANGTLFIPGDLVADFVTALPKAELHLHVEGTLEPELAFTLAARNAVALPFPDVASLRRAYQFSDLQSFLDLYYACMAVLRTEEDSVIAGLTRAAREAELAGGPTVGLIACLLRDHGPASAVETVEALAGYRDALTGIGLDSAEVGYPPANYAAAFELAGQLGLRKVARRPDSADRVPAVQRPAEGRAEPGRAPAARAPRRGRARHDQLRRPGVLRRVRR